MMKTRILSKSGITLIEMLTAVVIVGIVSAMAVPRFQIAWERLSMRSADRELVSLLRLTRSTAISTKEPHGVRFDQDSRSITVFRDVVNLGANLFEAGDSVIQADTLPPEFTFLSTDMTDNVLVFRPNGSAGFTGGGNIVALAATEKVIGILNHNVLAATGRIHSSSLFF